MEINIGYEIEKEFDSDFFEEKIVYKAKENNINFIFSMIFYITF